MKLNGLTRRTLVALPLVISMCFTTSVVGRDNHKQQTINPNGKPSKEQRTTAQTPKNSRKTFSVKPGERSFLLKEPIEAAAKPLPPLNKSTDPATRQGLDVPANDNFADAIALQGDVNGLVFSTIDATLDGPGQCSQSPNIWYCYTPSCDGSATVSLCNSSYDTYLTIFEGCDTLGAFLKCNDDACGLSSITTFPVISGKQYLIEVSGYWGQTGEGTMNIDCTLPAANDNCADVVPLPLPMTATGSTLGATNDCDLFYEPQVWEAFTITECTDVTINFCATEQQMYNAYAVLVQGCPCGEVIYYNYVNYSSCPNNNPSLTWYSLPAGTYYYPIAANQYNPIAQYSIEITGFACPPAPANDNCADVAPHSLPYVANGTSAGATSDCPGLYNPEVWEAFTISECSDVTLDFCASPTSFSYLYSILTQGCPCNEDFRYANETNWYGCESGNGTMTWRGLPAGTYYYPIAFDRNGPSGQYSISMSSTACPPAPANDNCADVTPGTLPMTVTGTTSGATDDCPSMGWPQVWEAFTLTECMEVTIDFCGTSPQFQTYTEILVRGCPCGNWIFSDVYADYEVCSDGNPSLKWYGLPPGTYYFSVPLSYYGAPGESYTINISGVPCPPAPANDNCSDVVPGKLPLTAFGSTQGATNDSPVLEYAQVWEAFTITECMNVDVSFCGTSPAPYDGYQVLTTDCQSQSLIFAEYIDYASCSDDNFVIHFSSLPPGTYYYPVLSDIYDDGTNAYTIHITGGPCPIPCAAGGTCDEFISRFQLGDIDHSSACSGYVDNFAFDSLSTAIFKGASYPFVVTNGTPNYPEDQCGIWIDWNQDGDFFDNGEEVVVNGNPSVGPYTGVIAAPEDAAIGETRLRVRIVYTDLLRPCGITEYGEAEDYKIVVEAPTQLQTISPNPQFTYCKFAVEPITDTVFMGNFPSGYSAEAVNLATLKVNGLTPVTATVIPSYPGYVGSVVRLTFPLSTFVAPYDKLVGTSAIDYKIAGTFSSLEKFAMIGDLTIIGREQENQNRYIAPSDYVVVPGDFDVNGLITISDVVSTINYIFAGGDPPSNLLIGDVDCSTTVSISDAVYMINYIFAGGQRPSASCP